MLKKLSLAVAVASASLSGMAFAETVETPVGKLDVTMTATLASDYISRGYSLNGGAPTVQGSLDVAHDSGLYIGVWASNWDEGKDSGGASEFDYYLGYGSDITDDISFDVSVAKFVYPRTDYPDDLEYALSLTAYGATAGVKYRAEDTKQLYTFIGYDLELGAGFGLSAAVGHTAYDEEIIGEQEDYIDWSLGVSKTLAGLDLSVTYASNDDTEEDNILFSVSKTF